MNLESKVSRRRVLGLGVAAAGLVALDGCGAIDKSSRALIPNDAYYDGTVKVDLDTGLKARESVQGHVRSSTVDASKLEVLDGVDLLCADQVSIENPTLRRVDNDLYIEARVKYPVNLFSDDRDVYIPLASEDVTLDPNGVVYLADQLEVVGKGYDLARKSDGQLLFTNVMSYQEPGEPKNVNVASITTKKPFCNS